MELERVTQASSEESFGDCPERNAWKLLTEAGQGACPPQTQILDIFQQVINGLPEQIALVDEQWKILAVNQAWTHTARLYGYELEPGADYLTFCEARAVDGHKPAGIAAAGIRAMELEGEKSFRYVYSGHGAWEGRSFQLCINRFDVGGRTYGTITRYDVSELVNLRHMREDFASSVMAGQDQERRRIAREVHDSTMQLLASLGLSLGQLKRNRRSKATLEIVDEMEEMLSEAQRELRTISFLAHPPQLKELGLVPALKQLAGGFARRTGLQIDFGCDGALHVGPTAEVAIYRTVQEALSNAHRHAQATRVAVGLHLRHSCLHLVVTDNGRGMPERLRQGVGLAKHALPGRGAWRQAAHPARPTGSRRHCKHPHSRRPSGGRRHGA
jgi:two-component system, NarL family, sensor kinase